MPPELERITEEALALPASSRAELAQKLLESLDDPAADEDVPAAEEIEQGWAAEAERRCRDLDEGKVQRLPGEDVLREIRSSFR